MTAVSTKKRVTALGAFSIIGFMLLLTAASVPLYRLFCQVTGYGGTTQVGSIDGIEAVDHFIEVSFNADTDTKLAWKFKPVQRKVTARIGEEHLIFYEAENIGDQPLTGTAVFNVTPHKVGYYFNKIHCFCFEEQTLMPGEKVQMPVSFFIDPEMLENAETKTVKQITLSYTFFASQPSKNQARATQKPVGQTDETS